MTLSGRQRSLAVVAAAVLGSALIFVLDGLRAEDKEEHAFDVEVKNLRGDDGDASPSWPAATIPTLVSSAEVPADAPELAPTEAPVADPTPAPVDQCVSVCDEFSKEMGSFDLDSLVASVEHEKAAMYDRIRADYGKYFEGIFLSDDTDPVIAIGNDHNSTMHIIKRKLKIKVLKAQLAAQEYKASQVSTEGCDCAVEGSDRFLEQDENKTSAVEDPVEEEEDEDLFFEKYVWATGGHSAAAAHGNLFNESYTAYMTRDLQPVFSALGIDFIGRNYAMGGTRSSPELASCYPQVFGVDVDFFSWDFGMTDGKGWNGMAYYVYRGMIGKNFPPLMALHNGGNYRNDGSRALGAPASLGGAALELTKEGTEHRKKATPDTLAASQKEIDEMPEYLRLLKCGDAWEGGDPCESEKYTIWGCEKRSKQAGWHPGYKAHAMDGHAMSIFMVSMLVDAVKELAEDLETPPKEVLVELEKEEEQNRKDFLRADIPDKYANTTVTVGEGESEIPSPFDPGEKWKLQRYCRTARLPAESRYLGITTNTDKIGPIANLGEELFDTGVSRAEAQQENASLVVTPTGETKREMILVYQEGSKERVVCNATIKPDYKDYWYIHYSHGWQSQVLPNEKEIEAYDFDWSKVRGLINIIQPVCDWNKCDPHELRFDKDGHFSDDMMELTVNGKKVVGVKPLSDLGHFLIAEDGFVFKPNAEGKYEISARSKNEEMFIKISSFVIF